MHILSGTSLPNIPWEDKPQSCTEPIWRFSGNPIIGRNGNKRSNSVFNSAVVPFRDGFAGVFRCDSRSISMDLFAGFSKDGYHWQIEDDPIVFEDADPEILKKEYRYDARITMLEGKYYITWCNGYHGPTIGAAWTEDFKIFHQLENAFLPFNRNGVLFPRKINGMYMMLSLEEVQHMDDIELLQRLKRCCKRMRISSALADRAMVTEGETNQECLLHLLEEEVRLREEAKVSKAITSAHFPRVEHFDYFVADEVQFPPDVSITSLKSLDFLEKNQNVIMYGGTGTGKTMLSICIGLQACRMGIPVKFYRTAKFINKLNEQKKRGTYEKFIKQLDDTPVLILDEFGYVPYDRVGSELMFDYLSERHEESRRVVILNTNLEFSQWVNVLYNAKMTTALVGRLTHHCQLLLFPGVNHRLKESSINDFYNAMTNNKGVVEP